MVVCVFDATRPRRASQRIDRPVIAYASGCPVSHARRNAVLQRLCEHFEREYPDDPARAHEVRTRALMQSQGQDGALAKKSLGQRR